MTTHNSQVDDSLIRFFEAEGEKNLELRLSEKSKYDVLRLFGCGAVRMSIHRFPLC